MADHVHTPSGADECFGCKMAYIRKSGGLSLATPKMGNGVSFYDTTIKEQQNRMVAECRANGWEPRLKNPVYDR